MCDMNLSYFSRCLSPFSPAPPFRFLMAGFRTPSFAIALFTNHSFYLPSMKIPTLDFSITRDDIATIALFSLILLKVAFDVMNFLTFLYNLVTCTERKVIRTMTWTEKEEQPEQPEQPEQQPEDAESDDDSLPGLISLAGDEPAFKPTPVYESLNNLILQEIDASEEGVTCAEIHRSLNAKGYTALKPRINSNIWRMARHGVLAKNGQVPPKWTRA